MLYTPLTRKALNVAYKAHEGQQDESGLPYIFHPYHVAEQMSEEIAVCVALLHDILEDTEVTDEELSRQFPEEVMVPLRLLNHNKEEDYLDYIRRLRENSVARAVKLADITHNSDESRLSGLDIPQSRLQHWRDKYAAAKKVLLEKE